MRIVIGGCYGEVHTFLTARTEFRDLVGQEILDEYRDTRSFIGGFIDGADEAGVELVPAVFSSVGASPLPTRASYERSKKEMLDWLRTAGKIDGVLLNLHGALAVEGMNEGVEGDYVRGVRDVVGSGVPIVCTADPHGNVSQAWVEAADVIIANNSIPEIDGHERGLEALENLMQAVRGDTRPVMALRKPGMLTPTGVQMANFAGMKPEYPMAKIWQEGFEWEAVRGVLKVNVFPGFFREDVENVGAGVVVVTDDDLALAERVAEEVARVMWDVREDFWLEFEGAKEAVNRAMATEGRPVILHNPEDDPAGGAPADGTEILRALMEEGAAEAAIWLHDAEAVSQAVAAGVGNPISVEVGGKLVWREDGKHPQPVMVSGRVRLLSDGRLVLKGPMGAGTKVDMGRSAVIEAAGVDLVISESRRAPTFDPELFRSVGIEPTDKKIVVIKQTHHWRAAYEPIVASIISVTCPTDHGVGSGPVNRLTGEPSWPYRNVPRPIWPLDENAEMWF